MARKSKAKAKSDNTNHGPNVANKGTNTKGVNVGDVREIESTKLGPIERVQREEIAPIERVTAAQVDKTEQQEFRKRQLALADNLEASLRGEGPSLAGIQLQQATDRTIGQQMALSRSGGGALAARSAAANIAQINQQAAAQSAQIRFAEALQAQDNLGKLLESGRASDIDIAKAQALLDDAANRANAAAFNARATEQARLNQNADITNATQQNQLTQAQGNLDQNAAIANQSAFNQKIFTQADINRAIRQSEIAAAAQRDSASIGASGSVRAAGIGAGASRYATDASLYKFNQELGFEMDKYYQGQGSSNIQGGYNTDMGAISNAQNIGDRQNESLNNVGGSLAALAGGPSRAKFANALR